MQLYRDKHYIKQYATFIHPERTSTLLNICLFVVFFLRFMEIGLVLLEIENKRSKHFYFRSEQSENQTKYPSRYSELFMAKCETVPPRKSFQSSKIDSIE